MLLPVRCFFQDLQHLVDTFLHQLRTVRIAGTSPGLFTVCNNGFDNELFDLYCHVLYNLMTWKRV